MIHSDKFPPEEDVKQFLYHIDDPLCYVSLPRREIQTPYGFSGHYDNFSTTNYGISSDKQCPSNPNCFGGLVDTKFLAKLDSPETIDEVVEQKLGPDPISSIKSAYLPKSKKNDKQPEPPTVGLQNLGATCYMNSLIQCIFSDTTYRQAIFDYTPKVRYNSKLDTKVCRKLRMVMCTNIFAWNYKS